MANGPFGNFGFTPSADILRKVQDNFRNVVASGDKDSIRAATVMQASDVLSGGSPALRKAKATEKVLQDALEAKTDTGDEILDEISFLKNAAKAAAEAGLPEIAIQATERLSLLRTAQEERARIRRQDARDEYRFEEEVEEDEFEDAQQRLQERQKIAAVGMNAYQDTLQSGGSELTARQNARKAQLSYFAAQTEAGDLGAGTDLARQRGFDLSVSTFNPNEARALSTDSTRQYKGITTVMGPDGKPQLAFVVQGESGDPEIIPSGFADADAILAASKASSSSSGKITDAQRKAANYAVQINQSQQIFDELALTGQDFTGLGATFEQAFLNRWKSEDRQRFEQATANFVQTYLRDVSGATIKGEEIQLDTKRFIPQPGDTPEMVAQKARNRRAYQAGLMAQAGDEAYRQAAMNLKELEQDALNRRLDARGY